MAATINLKIGDSVVVKSGVKDPNLDIDIEGWQGRVIKVDAKHDLICIAWDSVTLKSMPDWVIKKCEEEGLDWRQTNLETTAVELATPRDTQKAVEKMIAKIEAKYAWDYLDEEDKRIQAVLADVDPDDEWAAVDKKQPNYQVVHDFASWFANR